MKNWIRAVSEVMSLIDRGIDIARGYIAEALGIEDPIHILPYRGYGTPSVLIVKGRVIKDEGIKLKEDDVPLWENLWNMYKRFATDEVPNARLRVSLSDFHEETVTDREGFFELELHLQKELKDDNLWHPVELSLLSPRPKKQEEAIIDQTEVMVVGEGTEFGIISDIDDTIVHTAATDLLKMIRIAYMGNAQSRTPIDGVAKFYQALQGGKNGQYRNPIFYVSSSAWNMYDVFARFMKINEIPKGPIFLRDIEFSLENWLSFQHENHKFEQIEPIFQRLPQMPFILIGDSGQKDVEIYSTLAKRHPNRILGILIRDVVPNNLQRQQELKELAAEIAACGSEFLLFRDTQEAMDYAIHRGWISALSQSVADR